MKAGPTRFLAMPRAHVDIDALSDKARSNYFYARTVVGREVSVPAVRPNCDA